LLLLLLLLLFLLLLLSLPSLPLHSHAGPGRSGQSQFAQPLESRSQIRYTRAVMWGSWPALLAPAVVADLAPGVLGARPQLLEEPLALRVSPDPHGQAGAQSDTSADAATATATAAAAATANRRAGTATAAGAQGQAAPAADAAIRAETAAAAVATDASTAAAGAEGATAASADEAAAVGGGGVGRAECTDDMSIKQLEDALQFFLLRLDYNQTRTVHAETIGTCLLKNEKRLAQLAPETLHAVLTGVMNHAANQDWTVRYLFASSVIMMAPVVWRFGALSTKVIETLEVRLTSEDNKTIKEYIHRAFEKLERGLKQRRKDGEEMQDRLTGEVGIQVEVNDEDQVCVPRGIMLFAVDATRGGIRAHRCPNRKACGSNGANDCWDWTSLRSNSTLNHTACAPGYDPTVPGCAKCLPSFGRSRIDPFTCSNCGNPVFVWAKEIMASGAVFAASLHSISAGRKDELGSLLNIFMSFSFSAITASTLMQDTEAYGQMVKLIKESRWHMPTEIFDVPLLIASAGTGGLTDSPDCMGVDFEDSFAIRTLLESLVPMLLLLAAIGGELVRRACQTCRAGEVQAEVGPMDDGGQNAGGAAKQTLETGAEEYVKEPEKADENAKIPQEASSLGGPGTLQDVGLQDMEVQNRMPVKIMHISLTFTNLFLPGIFASALLQWPCFHTQAVHQDFRWYKESRRAWDPGEQCPSVYTVTIVIGAFVAFVIGPVMGPAFWAYLIANMDQLPQRSLDFMVAPYKEESKAWEVTVLMRKMALVALAAIAPKTYASASYATFAVAIMGIALAAHLYWQPYKSNLLNRVEGISLFATFTATVLTNYVVAREWSHTLVHQIIAVVLVFALLLMTLLLLLSLFFYGCCQKLLAWLSSVRHDLSLVP
ncbi:unnamed protein product, partial [Prorocentrum cordatum]